MAFIGNTPTTQAFTPAVDYFSGNGSTTAFTLSRPVASVAQVEAVVNNVVQNPSSAYTVSGNTITFTSAPSSGTNNIYVRYTSPITQVIAPSQGSVNTTSFASSTGTGAGVFQTNPTLNTPTLTGPTMSGAIVSAMASSVITSGTVVNTTSGTSATFSSIPSWVKRITVMFNGVSASSTSYTQLQVGYSGSVQTSGYTGNLGTLFGTSVSQTTMPSSAFYVTNKSSTADIQNGTTVLTNVSGNTWVVSGTVTAYNGSNQRTNLLGGSITLSGVLNIISITENGGGSYTAGSINILYE